VRAGRPVDIHLSDREHSKAWCSSDNGGVSLCQSHASGE
jgi:hypothetical protein